MVALIFLNRIKKIFCKLVKIISLLSKALDFLWALDIYSK